MSDIALRVGLLAIVVATGFLAIWWLQRRTGTSRAAGLPSGLLLVTGPDCRWCDRLVAALSRRSGIDYSLLDVADAGTSGLLVRSLPTALVIDREGSVVLRRSGPAAVHDLDVLIDRAQRR